MSLKRMSLYGYCGEPLVVFLPLMVTCMYLPRKTILGRGKGGEPIKGRYTELRDGNGLLQTLRFAEGKNKRYFLWKEGQRLQAAQHCLGSDIFIYTILFFFSICIGFCHCRCNAKPPTPTPISSRHVKKGRKTMRHSSVCLHTITYPEVVKATSQPRPHLQEGKKRYV